MERDFKTVLVEQCATVLAGLRPAGLFRHETSDRPALLATIAHCNSQFAAKGLRLQLVKECPHTRRYLVYVFRPAQLAAVLRQPQVQHFLAGEGYALPAAHTQNEALCGHMIAQLAQRLCNGPQQFPHEIGVFLGYPLADVVGFIQNRGQNYTCCGCWKAYTDAEQARRRFAHFDRCTRIYLQRLHGGTPLARLAVATAA